MRKISILFICMLITLSSCGVKTEAPPVETSEPIFKKISADEAREIMLSGEDFILLDVRSAEEHREIRIEGSILIPNNELANRAEAELPDKNALILIHCRSGGRSATAASTLRDMGYTKIYDFGGVMGWPYETISD